MSANTVQGHSNPAYFGYPPIHQSFDLTALVNEVEGERRNLPQIQFQIRTPLGIRTFVTYREGIDGVTPGNQPPF